MVLTLAFNPTPHSRPETAGFHSLAQTHLPQFPAVTLLPACFPPKRERDQGSVALNPTTPHALQYSITFTGGLWGVASALLLEVLCDLDLVSLPLWACVFPSRMVESEGFAGRLPGP